MATYVTGDPQALFDAKLSELERESYGDPEPQEHTMTIPEEGPVHLGDLTLAALVKLVNRQLDPESRESFLQVAGLRDQTVKEAIAPTSEIRVPDKMRVRDAFITRMRAEPNTMGPYFGYINVEMTVAFTEENFRLLKEVMEFDPIDPMQRDLVFVPRKKIGAP